MSIVPFSDAYDTHCARYGREADAPILAFKARCCSAGEGITADAKARLEAYQEVVEKGVTENIFSQFMYKTMVENNLSMWIIKKQFALSAAMSGGCRRRRLLLAWRVLRCQSAARGCITWCWSGCLLIFSV